MKIVQIVAGRGDGGLERHVISLANELAQRHDVTFVGDPTIASRLSPRVTARPLDLRRSRWNPFVKRQLARLLCDLHPDIIHAHANKAAAIAGALPGTVPGQRVATIHGLKRNTRMYRDFAAVIAVSRAVADRVAHPNVTVIYNGIPPANATAAAWSGARPLALAVGRLVPVKGFDVLLRAWRGLPGQLLIAGDGPERRHLEKLAAGLPNVEFLGHRQDVPAWIRAADLIVISSRREGFPLILAEALQAHRVVVSTQVPGVSELLPPELLAPPENVAALHRLLAATLADLPAAACRCEAAWQFADAELSLAQMVAKTETVYLRVKTNQS